VTAVLEKHDYFTRRQKKLSAMDPNVKMMFEKFMKQVCEEIRDDFVMHKSIVTSHP
jgi:hypothetical protein